MNIASLLALIRMGDAVCCPLGGQLAGGGCGGLGTGAGQTELKEWLGYEMRGDIRFWELAPIARLAGCLMAEGVSLT